MKRFGIFLSLILTACAPAATQALVVPEFLAQSTAYLDPSYPTAQVAIESPNQSASGFDVRVDRVWMDGKKVSAVVCFTLPDRSDWAIWSASLNYAGNVLQEYETTLVSIQDSSEGKSGQRCDTITFVVAPDADLTEASIAIHSFGATPREGEYCSVYMPKIQQSILERGVGIALDCVDVNGTLTMQIKSIPPEMSQEQAEQIVFSDEFYTVKGPWIFSFKLTQ